MFCKVTHKPGVTILSKCEACSGLLPCVFLEMRSDEKSFYFPLMSHLHNPTSTTAVGYLERQGGFRWGSFGETQHLQLGKTSFSLKLQKLLLWVAFLSLPPLQQKCTMESSTESESEARAEVRTEVFWWWCDSLMCIQLFLQPQQGASKACCRVLILQNWKKNPKTTSNPILSLPSGSFLQLLLTLEKLILGGWGRKETVV